MRDQDACPAFNQRINRLLDQAFGNGIQRGGGLVEDQQRRVLQQHPGDGNPLLLSAGKLQSPVAHHRIQPLRLTGDEIPDVRLPAGLDHLLLRRLRLGVQQVVPDGSVEQIGFLGHHADAVPQGLKILLPHVHAVKEHPSPAHVPQPGNQVHDGALSAAAGADDRHAVPAFQFKRNILQNRPVLRICEGHVLKAYLAPPLLRNHRMLRLGDFYRHVKIFKNPREHGHGPDPFHLHVQQVVHRAVHPSQQRHQHGDIAHRQLCVVFHHQDAAHQIQQHRADAGQGAQHHKEPSARHPLLDIQADHPAVGLLIAAVLVLLPAEQLHQQLPGDRKGFIQDAVDFVVAGLGFPRQLPSGLSRQPGGQREKRYDHDPDQRQDPVLLKHGRNRHHQRQHVGQDAGEGAGHYAFHPADIAGHPGDHVPLVGGGKKALAHFLKMPEHLVAHVIGDMLGHPGVQIALGHADQVRPQRQPQGQHDVQDQRLQIPPDQPLVQNFACDNRGEKRTDGGHGNADQHQQKLFPVGLQIAENPRQQLLRYLRPVLLFLFGQKAPGHGATSWRHAVFLPVSVFSVYSFPP